MKSIQLYWWQHQHDPGIRNFGDQLSPLIVEMVSGRSVEHAPLESCEMVAIGSLIEQVQKSKRREPVQLWGTGFIYQGPPNSDRRIRAAAVRGPLSAERFGDIHNMALGDPGILCHQLLGKRPAKKYSLGVIPHYVDLELPLIAEYRRHGRYPVLSPLMSPRDFIHAVAECEVIVSSALHGNITADSLGIPNQWTVLSQKVLGEGYKFQDYLGLFDTHKLLSVDLPPPDLLSSAFIDTIIANYARPGLDAIQDKLASAFPQL